MADAADSASARALTGEVIASEQLRVRVLVGALAVLVAIQLLVLLFAGDQIARVVQRPVPWWVPLAVFGPFLAYESGVMLLLRSFAARGRGMPTAGRFGNALVETSLPTAVIFGINHFSGSTEAFGMWPPMLYFIFILASTLRLDFTLPLFTGAVAAVEYTAFAAYSLPLSWDAGDPLLSPLYHASKSLIMLAAGVIAGLVAMRLRAKLLRVIEEAAARERVIGLFGQHVSPAVVGRLLEQPAEMSGETREVCVMFLDIRNFTAAARQRRPTEVVDYLNSHFAFMIEAVDRHRGIVNKFLGDGFIAIFGAPLDDPRAAHNAVACAREILAEIDRRGLAAGAWPLNIGIGIDIGPVVTGNVGSPRRKEFTVIGDAVNFASRLEQLNKELGTRLLVSDAVAHEVGPALEPSTPLGEVLVKGYATPLRVWRLDP